MEIKLFIYRLLSQRLLTSPGMIHRMLILIFKLIVYQVLKREKLKNSLRLQCGFLATLSLLTTSKDHFQYLDFYFFIILLRIFKLKINQFLIH